MPPPEPQPLPEELLWSWVDRNAPELEAHLAAYPQDRPRVEALRQQIDAISAANAAPPGMPEWIGGYRVTGFLGAGAMGVVYAARQQRPDREVALKVLKTWGLGDPHQLARFEREVAALGRLQHAAIATIHEAGRTDDGIPFLVMERVHGESLLNYVARAGLDREARIELFCAICDGVQAAHVGGVVHRDLKPGNILVDEAGGPRIVDFGLARLLDGEAAMPSHSATGFAGTLPYMSPEQLDGSRGPIDEQSDIYALGVLLHELLLGCHPHALAGLPLSTLVRKVCDEPPAPPRSIDRTLPHDLQVVILKALAADRSHRYASARALADDLRRYLAGEPVLAAPPRWTVRARTWVRRHRRIALGATVVALAGLAATGWLRTGSATDAQATAARFATGPAPELAPFANLRWRREAIEIEHDGAWWDVLALAGRPAAAFVTEAKARDPEQFRSVVRRDIAALIAQLAPETPVDRVPIDLKPVGRIGEAILIERPLSRTAWLALQERGDVVLPTGHSEARPTDRVAAFAGIRWIDDRVEVLDEGTWFELESVFGIPVTELRERAMALESIRSQIDWRKRFIEDLPWLLGQMGYSIEGVVTVELRDLTSRELLPPREVTLTAEKRRQLKDA